MNRRFIHEVRNKDLSLKWDSTIAILGCGAIGGNLAISLARRGFRSFMLVDHDRVAEHNISTQPWYIYDVDKMKATSLANLLYMLNQVKAPIYQDPVKTLAQLRRVFPQQTVLAVDCFDNAMARSITRQITWCPVMHVGMSGEDTGEVTWNDRYQVPPDVNLTDPCDYPMGRTLVELTVVAAAEAVLGFLGQGVQRDYFIQARQLKITRV